VRASLTDRLRTWSRDPMVRRIGTALVLGISALFLLRSVRNVDLTAMLATLGAGDIALLAVCCIAYGALLMLLARGWSIALDVPQVDWRHAVAIYGTSVLPKYLPGSVPQYLSRHVLSQRYGWPASTMARSSVLEIALHVLCSLAVAACFLLWPGSTRTLVFDWRFIVVGLTALAAVAITLWAYRRFRPAIVFRAMAYQLAFFAGFALLAIVCGIVSGVPANDLPAVGGLFLLSWLISFVVPLAPGGLGVREAAGVALLSGIIGPESALFVLAAMRLITLGGDVLMIGAGYLFQRGGPSVLESSLPETSVR